MKVGSLSLSLDGELIFGNDAKLTLDNALDEDCQFPQEGSQWVHSGEDSWWDPFAWSHNKNFRDPVASPVPHVHRVPCMDDLTHFPNTSTALYQVHLKPPRIVVQALAIGKKNYTTSELASYASISSRFVGTSSGLVPLYIESANPCWDITGCPCARDTPGDDQPQFLRRATAICEAARARCPKPICRNPIPMEGFCCNTCGADIAINHGGRLALSQVQVLMSGFMADKQPKDVMSHAAKMDDDKIHVYFTATSNQGDYQSAAHAFHQKFIKELGGEGNSTVYASRMTTADAPKGSASSSSAGHTAAVVIVTLLFCVALLAAGYYVRKRRALPELAFMFRRLSQDRRISMSSTIGGRRRSSAFSTISGRTRSSSTASTTLTPSADGTGFRFVNPAFNKKMESVEETEQGTMDTAYASLEHVDGQHENPMYAVFQKMSTVEKQASEDTLKSHERMLEAAGNLAAVTEKVAAAVEDEDLAIEGQQSSATAATVQDEDEHEGDRGNLPLGTRGEDMKAVITKIESKSQKANTLQESEQKTESMDSPRTPEQPFTFTSNEDFGFLVDVAESTDVMAEAKTNGIVSVEDFGFLIDVSDSNTVMEEAKANNIEDVKKDDPTLLPDVKSDVAEAVKKGETNSDETDDMEEDLSSAFDAFSTSRMNDGEGNHERPQDDKGKDNFAFDPFGDFV